MHGDYPLELQGIIVRILSQTTSASHCEGPRDEID